jgi:hypothetical protein
MRILQRILSIFSHYNNNNNNNNNEGRLINKSYLFNFYIIYISNLKPFALSITIGELHVIAWSSVCLCTTFLPRTT